ncbi:MAG: DUF4855 domain-containing protein [Clostridia bacterium]|nr:DUF4855 domain-containing protein [Clostridia bacterium]
MKKWFLGFLAAMMLLTSCGDTIPDESTNESSETSNGTEQSYRTLISVGKSYTAENVPACEEYPDFFGQQLTDGIKAGEGADYTETRAVGFKGNTTVTIDLGEDGKAISAIVLSAIDMGRNGGTAAGVAAPSMARVSGSNDGKKFTHIGSAVFKRTGDKTISKTQVELETPTDYRYIRVKYSKFASAHFMFIDEIEVYANVPPRAKANIAELAYMNESIDRTAWKALSTGNAATPVEFANVLNGKAYIFENCAFDERAPKNDSLLTDGGRTHRIFGDKAFVAVMPDGSGKPPAITIDLGKRLSNLYSFKIHALGEGTNVDLPEYIDIYGTQDGKNYILIGRAYAPADCSHYAYTVILDEYISASKLKFEFPTTSGSYWIEEIEAFAGYSEKQQTTLFPELNIPTVEAESFWSTSESDYSKKQNLLIGADRYIARMDYDGIEERPEHHHPESSYDIPALTDGKFTEASAPLYEGEYFFAIADCLDFFFDLGNTSAVSELNVSMLESKDMAVYRPEYITVFLSDDADHWYKVGYYDRNDAEINAPATKLNMSFKLDKAYAARFVRFRIERPAAPHFIFIDELEAIGTKEVKSSAVRLADSEFNAYTYYTSKERSSYATLENTSLNSKDMPLICLGQGEENQLLPMVAYLDENGEIKDTMFDGFLYWAGFALPSGAATYQPATFADWKAHLDYTFNNSVNGIDKLEETVQQVKDALNIPDYKVKVYVSSLSVFDDPASHGGGFAKNVTEFGDIDGDGVSENMTLYEDRQKLYSWFINAVYQKFEAKGYKNIEFDGINYMDESVYLECDNAHCIAEFGEAVKNAGTNFIWIPYYSANRFYLGEEMHFDAVCMQPNYAFDNHIPEWRLEASAELVKRLQMSIELEHHYLCFGDKSYARQYMKYLASGVTFGFIDGIHMYFQDNDDFGRLGYSDSPLCRMQYDATYHFIKGDLNITPEKRDEYKIEATKNTILNGSLKPEEKEFELYTITKQTKHGIVALNSDGEFVYYPDKDFVGEDSFSYTYNEYLGESEECTVTITVK